MVYWNMDSSRVYWNMNPSSVYWNVTEGILKYESIEGILKSDRGYIEIWIQGILKSDRGYTEIWIQGILKSDRGYTEIWILEGILKYTFIEYWGFLNRNKYTEIIKIFRILKKMSKNFASDGYTEIPKLSSMSCQQHHPHACNVDFQFPMPLLQTKEMLTWQGLFIPPTFSTSIGFSETHKFPKLVHFLILGHSENRILGKMVDDNSTFTFVSFLPF